MSDYRDKLDEWRDAARRKAREIDEKYNVRERVEEGARAAGEAARRKAESVAGEAARARGEAERLAEDFNLRERAEEAREKAKDLGERARRAAEDAAKSARGAGESLRTAGKGAGKAFDGAKRYYERAARVYGASARTARLTTATTKGLYRAYDWARENPKRAIVVTLSLAGGAHSGALFPGLDAVLLGSHPHWFTHSALPVWALRRAGDAFDKYILERERLAASGDLTEAERKRVEFERKIVRYVGAPLLGAFSFGAGLTMWAQIFQPGTIVGAPIGWLTGGNPFLSGVWLFANGVVCFQQGYKFFMIALRDQEEATRIVRELKGFLPAARPVEA